MSAVLTGTSSIDLTRVDPEVPSEKSYCPPCDAYWAESPVCPSCYEEGERYVAPVPRLRIGAGIETLGTMSLSVKLGRDVKYTRLGYDADLLNEERLFLEIGRLERQLGVALS